MNGVQKIAVVGPESSGKSTLAEDLAKYFHSPLVPEYAREFLEQLNRPYEIDDLITIAKGQLALEKKYSLEASDLLICDTNLLVIKVWSLYKYNTCDPWLEKAVANMRFSFQLLCQPDIPWSFDPYRENPHDRDILYTIYKKELEKHDFKFAEISGQGEDRIRNAIKALKSL